MQSYLCFSAEDALKAVMHALGGHKAVGVRLRPELEKDPDAAGRWFLNCINPERDEKLSLTQLVTLLRWAHDVGCHDAMDFIARDAGYTEPTPITPEDEQSELDRQFIQAVGELSALAAKIDRNKASRAKVTRRAA